MGKQLILSEIVGKQHFCYPLKQKSVTTLIFLFQKNAKYNKNYAPLHHTSPLYFLCLTVRFDNPINADDIRLYQ